MKMECLADYDILRNDSSLSSKFVVQHKATGKLYCIQSILSKDLTETEQKVLMKKISIRITISHPNILQFHGHFQYNDGILYIKQEFCKYGTLACFIQKVCIQKNRQLHENFICRMLYQIVLALKTVECFMGELSLDTILLNEDFNIKLYNFPNFAAEKNKSQKQKEIKTSHLGVIMIELCTLKTFDKCTNFEADIQEQNYSDTLKALLGTMVKDNTEIKKHINKLLCHPTILLQSTEWDKSKCFIENNHQTLTKKLSMDCPENAPQTYSDKLDKLRRKEAALQIKEQLLKEQERKLAHKEKKIQIMERTVKEKLQQADLYLKRCREGGKSISSASSKSSGHSQSSAHSKVSKKMYEETDPDYVTCGDSDVLPTSTKLQIDRIVKPQNFSRTLSERRIRFKISPLKDHNFNRKGHARKSLRHSKILEEHADLENIAPNQNDETNRKKTLFPSNDYENDFTTMNKDCDSIPQEIRNMGWTEETKRYAFEMLRLMNDDGQENADIKHTFL